MDTCRIRCGVLVTVAIAICSTAHTEEDRANDAQKEAKEFFPSDRWTGQSLYFALQTELVQSDLQLAARQKGRVKQLRTAFEEIIRDLGKQYLALSPEKRNSYELQERIQEAAAVRLKPQIQQVLTQAQFHRLNQIVVQANGIYGLTLPGVAEHLQLAKDQQESLKVAARELTEATRLPDELFGFGENRVLNEMERKALSEKHQERYWKARIESVEKGVNVLNADQRRRLDEFWGKRIDPRTLSEQEAKADVNVVLSGLTVQVSAGGSFFVGTLSITPRPQ